MADKKKKIFNKEPLISKRPVILKSEREVPKEMPKEKVEKEKQPMIILKTRETSTPKDDHPQSPKLHNVDGEQIQPNKIAQNEHSKDRKQIVTDQKLCQPIPIMQEPVKLLDENLEFNNSALEFLHDSSTNYLVVGIIGTQSVGKSMVLNLLSKDMSMQDICNKILTSHELPKKENTDPPVLEDQLEELNFVETEKIESRETEESYFKFKMQDIEQIERGAHCTKGIDMYVTNDRVILLDCQALWSPSLLDDMSGYTNPVLTRSYNVVTVDSLQLASYLMAVCHVLIAVQDWFTDYNFLRYIETAEMLIPSLLASHATSSTQESAETSNNGESHPHLLLLHNRCQLEDYTPENVKIMQTLYRKVFKKSNLQLNSGMYLYSDSNKNCLTVDPVCKEYNLESCGMPLNLFLLPEIYEDHANRDIYRGHPPFEKLAQRFRWMILGLNRHQITNVSNLSERGWFQYCNKAWETIRKCTFFMEYERFLP